MRLVFTSLLGLVYLYLGISLNAGGLGWLLLALLFGFVWALFVVLWQSETDRFSDWEILVQQISFLSMGILSWLLVLTLTRDLISAASLGRFAPPASWVIVGAFVFTSIGIWNAMRGLRIREHEVPIPGLAQELHGLRIVQISDLHVGPTIGRAYVERVVTIVNGLIPDLVVLTGDIVDGNLLDLKASVMPLAQLAPRGRVFYSPGNHEYYWTISEWLTELESLGATVLLNEGKRLFHRDRALWVGGVTDPAAGRAHFPDPKRAMNGGEDADLKILLSHRPDPAEEAARAGFHLQLSGHTHGGQFFPWTWVARLFHRHFLGLILHQSMWIHVSPGTGTWGPPLRIGTTPEVTLLKLVRKSLS